MENSAMDAGSNWNGVDVFFDGTNGVKTDDEFWDKCGMIVCTESEPGDEGYREDIRDKCYDVSKSPPKHCRFLLEQTMFHQTSQHKK